MNLLRKLKPNGIAVTELSSQLWCERQLLFGITLGKKLSPSMQRGDARHRELHEEVAELVQVVPKTFADVCAIQLNNCEAAVARLSELGFTRELPVFGKVNTLFLRGCIDEVKLSGNELKLIDTKTRFKASMPRDEQQQVSKFQMMLYRHLLNEIIERRFNFTDFLRIHRFKTTTEISDELKEQVRKLNPAFEINLYKIARKAFSDLQLLPRVSENLEVRYEQQQTHKPIGLVEFRFDHKLFSERCDYLEEMWLGKREPKKAMETESWKCAFCEFNDVCAKSGNLTGEN